MPELKDEPLIALFAAPFISHLWTDSEALNRELKDKILAQERDHPQRSVSLSNVGGWHSDTGDLAFCGEAGITLCRRMKEMGDVATAKLFAEQGKPDPRFGWFLEAWANVNRAGDFNRVHFHGLYTWSGTYYVDAGDPENPNVGTALELTDPNQARAGNFLPGHLPTSALIRPQPGLMVLFPSYVPHMVFPHKGASPRISIGFNLRKDPYP